ncbi:MAG: hypothetical protein JWR47_2013 [Phenylobacterium sp.]|nr:hypothetical protein [Phenylobacterium sp.]
MGRQKPVGRCIRMPRYQLYLLDEKGHIKEAVSFDVGSDEEAKDYVQVQGEQRAMELWSGSHVVEQYPARAHG